MATNQYNNKVIYNGDTLIDLSEDTVTDASHIMSGRVGHLASGAQVVGTGQGGGNTPTLITKSITTNGTYTASNDSADGYSSVTVNVSSSGITPTGTKQISITQNGTTTEDVTNYVSAQITVNVSGGTPSATAHTIYFEFSDNTNTTITAYWDDSFISDAITATTPTTYGQKTITLAQLDGVTWYSFDPIERWETIWDDNISWSKEDNGDYPYCWISSLGNTPITVGSVWRVTYNNTEYRCTGKTASLGGRTYTGFGNPVWSNGTDDGSGVPFVFIDYTIYGAWTGGLNAPNVDNSSYYFKIERLITS